MDFDSLAAELAVTKLNPAARMVLGYPLFGNVKSFLSLYRSSLPIVQMKYVDMERVSKVFMVDCQHLERVDEHAHRLFNRHPQKRPYTIYDHHQLDPGGLGPSAEPDSIIEPVGAATTLLIEQIKKKKVKLTPFEATVFTLGIYEDTGCLTYGGTTYRDAAAVAFLLKQGADLTRVSEYIHTKLSDEHARLLQELVKSAQPLNPGGIKVITATAQMEKFLPELAGLTRKLMEIESAGACFTAVYMRDRVHLVARSDKEELDVRRVVREFGGDGHPGAGSAVIKTRHPDEVIERVREIVSDIVKPERTAGQIMTTPVRTIRPTVTMDEASRIMIRYGQDGLVVTDDHEVVGIVSRRDIDQASHHRLGHAPVQGFMSQPVITINPGTPLSEIQEIMMKEDIGRLPVLDAGQRLVGLVSRQNVLRTLYGAGEAGEILPESERWRSSGKQGEKMSLKDELTSLIAPDAWLCELIGMTAAQLNMVAYAVGGFVRDLILSVSNFDLDFVVEGSAIELAEALEKAYPSRLRVARKHERFQTATLWFYADTLRTVDLSTARTEFYEYPAALPTVEPSSLEQDLLRRDFTINALAVSLNPGQFGNVVDFFGGIEDIRSGVIRILHPFSFIEDPTRIIRAARFAARFGFVIEPKTKEQARRAIAMGIFDDLGGNRIREELSCILESPERIKALDLLGDLGGKLRYLDSELEYGLPVRSVLRRAERLLEHYHVHEPWVVHMGLLLSGLPEERLNAALDRLHLSNDHKTTIKRGLKIPSALMESGGELKRSEIYAMLNGMNDASLAIAASLAAPGSPTRRMIKLYLDQLAGVSVHLTGNDLIKMGFDEGPEIGKSLRYLLNARLDGLVTTKEEELGLINQKLEKMKQLSQSQ